jgi:hypothetical protein
VFTKNKKNTTMTMKRSLQSEPSLAPLKRRSSSLFSIATLADDQQQEQEQEGLPNNNSQSQAQAQPQHAAAAISSSSIIRITPAPSPLPGSSEPTDDDSNSDSVDEGYFIEDSVEDPYSSISTSTSLFSCSIATTNNNNNTTLSLAADYRTGVVFEEGSRHFDRHNRLHKERPARVASVKMALTKNKVLSRCCQQQQQQQQQSVSESKCCASEFLKDDDYLRVHLPGYMQRYVQVQVPLLLPE